MRKANPRIGSRRLKWLLQLRPHQSPEPGELGRVIGLLPFLDVTYLSQGFIVSESAVELPVRGDLPQPLYHEGLEDTHGVPRRPPRSLPVIWLPDCFLYVV